MKISKRSIAIALSLVMAVSATAFGTIAYLTDRQSVTNTFTYGDVNITLDEAKVDENGNPAFPVADETDVFVSVDDDGTITIFNETETVTVGDDGKAVLGGKTYEVAADSEGNLTVNGKPVGENPRVTANNYKLVPGRTYIKDPTVTLTAGSEKSYVRMQIVVTNYSALKAMATEGGFDDVLTMFAPVMDTAEWTLFGTPEINTTANTITYEYRYNNVVIPGAGATVVPPLFEEITVPFFVEADDLDNLQASGGFKIEVIGYAVQAAGFADAKEAWIACDEQLGD